MLDAVVPTTPFGSMIRHKHFNVRSFTFNPNRSLKQSLEKKLNDISNDRFGVKIQRYEF